MPSRASTKLQKLACRAAGGTAPSGHGSASASEPRPQGVVVREFPQLGTSLPVVDLRFGGHRQRCRRRSHEKESGSVTLAARTKGRGERSASGRYDRAALGGALG